PVLERRASPRSGPRVGRGALAQVRRLPDRAREGGLVRGRRSLLAARHDQVLAGGDRGVLSAARTLGAWCPRKQRESAACALFPGPARRQPARVLNNSQAIGRVVGCARRSWAEFDSIARQRRLGEASGFFSGAAFFWTHRCSGSW